LPNNLNVLLKANSVLFLKEIVNSKFQLSLKEILSIKKFCQKELKYKPINEIIKPLLEERIPQANLDELFSMYSDKDSLFNEKIKPYIQDKIKDYSLLQLIVSLEINLEGHKFLDDFIEQILQAKINEACLDDLLKARNYVNGFSFIDSIKRFEDVLQDALRDNVPHIVDRFKKSSSYREAETNASLLAEVSDYLSATQWETILEGFCDNNQIYDSFGCPSTFADLFKKSVKIHGYVQPYWLSFREKLNQLNRGDININNLKDLMDSYVESK
jgi:hypothetical protein